MDMPSDAQIDELLVSLDAIARAQPYPPLGLGIHGSDANRPAMRVAVVAWWLSLQPEVQR